MIYGSFYVGSNFYLHVIRAEKTEEKRISLTFDDGPNQQITPRVLDVLAKFGIKAAFFSVGDKIAANPELLKRIHDEGHVIGNHTYTHSNWFDFYSSKRMIEELEKTEKIILDNTGKRVRYFRPPYGVTNPALAKAVKKMNYTAIGWNIRSLDTGKSRNAKKILARIIRQLKPGSIILLHDKNPELVDIIEKLIHFASENGYEFIRLDELINIDAYE
jgi:peptidoglycan/xylan/chitin deacetylase (PgdA/CDA1 family)